MELSEFKEYSRNPRRISADRFDKLGDSLTSLGDLGGIVINRRTNEIISGNQRTKNFLQERNRYTMAVDELIAPNADGTVARGQIIKDAGQSTEQRFSVRIVDWDEDKSERANIQANGRSAMRET